MFSLNFRYETKQVFFKIQFTNESHKLMLNISYKSQIVLDFILNTSEKAKILTILKGWGVYFIFDILLK